MKGSILRRHRKRLGQTQVALAARLGVHVITLSRWETGACVIPKTIATLAPLLQPVRKAARKVGPK
jgi:transcriptional regulator with XRE-family HTH domain